MCVIAAKPAGVQWLSYSEMRNCFTRNSDGAGIAWVDSKGLHVKKGFFKWKPLWQELKRLERYNVLLHCRLATHGSKTTANCHPFILNNGLAMAHNGIINIKPEGDMTDSEAFGKRYIGAFTENLLKSDYVQELIEASIGGGNKIVCLTKKGEFIFFNREAGHEKDGIWFSNSAYAEVKRYAFGCNGIKYSTVSEYWAEKFGRAHTDYSACDYCTEPLSTCETCAAFNKAVDDDIYNTDCDACERVKCLGLECPVCEKLQSAQGGLSPEDNFNYLNEGKINAEKIA